MALLNMHDVDGIPNEDIVKSDVWTHSLIERQLVLDKICQLIVDKFVNFSFTNATPYKSKDQVHIHGREVLSLGLFYFEFVDSIREGDGPRVIRCYKYLLPMFKSSNHTKYSTEIFHMFYQLYYSLSSRQSHQLMYNRFVNTHGCAGKNISCDLLLEHMNRVLTLSWTAHSQSG